jgi:pilus assembly protein FimV
VDKRFEPLATGEVLSVDESVQILIGHRTFRVSELADAIKTQLEYGIQGWTQDKDAWFSEEGIPCEVLRFTAQGWQKGKVRINLEFCPLDPEEEAKGAAARLKEKENSTVAQPTVSETDELDFEESSLDMSDEFELEASAAVADDLDLEDSLISTEDEFELETPVAGIDELEQEEPNVIYAEMHVESYTAVIQDDEVGMEDQVQVSLDDEFGMEDQVQLGLDDEFGMEDQVQTGIDDEFDMEDQMQLGLDDEFAMENPTQVSLDDEFDMEDQMQLGLDDEFAMENPTQVSLDDEFGMEDPMQTSLDDEFGMEDPMQISLDDEFDQISESIEQELELVESPQANSDELLDLGDISTDDDDDLDFGEMSMDSDDNIDFGDTSASSEFQFEEIGDLEDESTDSLLDDVWQDINQPSWQNNQ